jgi:hypothetical protein
MVYSEPPRHQQEPQPYWETPQTNALGQPPPIYGSTKPKPQPKPSEPVLMAGATGAVTATPWGQVVETFANGAANVAKGASMLMRFGAVGGIGAAIWGGPLAQPAGGKSEDILIQQGYDQARQRALQSTHDHGGGKNAQHGKADNKPSQEAQIEGLEAQYEELVKTQGSKSEKASIKKKIENIKKSMAKAKKGESHHHRD